MTMIIAGEAAATMTSRNETRTKMMQKFAERERGGLEKLLDVIEGIQQVSMCCAQPKMSPTDGRRESTYKLLLLFA